MSTFQDWNPATYEAAVASGNSAYAYCASKALAEKKAYELIEKSGSGIKLASINPPAVFSTVIHHLEKLSDLNESNKAIWTILSDPKGLAQEFHDYVDTRDVSRTMLVSWVIASEPLSPSSILTGRRGSCLSNGERRYG